jgi:hypothetical protein
MIITTLTEAQQSAIVINVSTAINENNIDLLSDLAYKFLYVCSGFFSHNNIYGFKNHYEKVQTLKTDLLLNYTQNMYHYMTPSASHYDSMMIRKAVYQEICKRIFI